MVMVHGEDMLPGAEEIGNGAYKGGALTLTLALALALAGPSRARK